MKRFVLFSTALFCLLFLLASGNALKAQVAPVQLWDFEKDFDGWYFAPEGGTALLSTEKATKGKRSVKFIGVNNSIEANFMNDTFKDFKEGDIVKFKVWVSAADLAYVNGFQIFWQTGDGWTWNSKWFGAASLKGNDWNTLDLLMPAVTAPFQRIGVQMLLQAGNEAKVPVIYIDEISVSRPIGEYYWTENWNNDTIEGRLTGTTSEAPTTLKDVNTSTGVWQAIYAIRGGSNQCDGTGKTLRLLSTTGRPQGGAAITPAVYGGIGIVKFVEGRGGTNRVIKVSKSRDNGTTWIDVKTINGTTKCEQILVEVNDGKANKLKFQNMSTGDVDIDNITFNTFEDALPPFIVSNWGKASSGGPWPILNNATTTAGNASMGDGKTSTGWSTLRGQFPVLTATTSQAVVLTGKLQLVGGGGESGYTHLRYALEFQDSTTLTNPLTETATWASTKGFFGYGFHPRSGTGTMSNARGGAGTLWLLDGGGFNSGWGGNNTAAVGADESTAQIEQAPRNAQMIAGTYNFAMSVKMITATTAEVRWYLVEENNKYWFGGTKIVKAKTDKFNGISFGVNNDSKATQLNLMSVKADLGEQITVPEAPWEAYYVDRWGKASSGGPWPIKNNAETLVGDATMGDGKPSTGWSTLRGGFGQSLPLKKDKELIVKGQMQLVGGGGGDAYTHLRYALTFQDSSTLKYALTDTAKWESTKGFYGYGFHPRSGNGTMSNARGGAGTLWLIDGGGFNSGWGGNNTAQVGSKGNTVGIEQAPRNAQMIEGTYNFAISVKMINDTTNQVKWYLVEENNKYWFGGTELVKSKTNKFNGIDFGVNNDSKATMFNVLEVKVDYGTITVPEAPWQAYYVDKWGKSSAGGPWPIKNNAETLVGDASMGDGKPSTGWSTLGGGFGQALPLKTDKELIVKGQLQYVGGSGGDAYTHLRYALTFQDSVTLKDALTENAQWSSTKGFYGYSFHPRTGNGTMSNARGGAGTLWLVDGGGFHSGWGGNNTAQVGSKGNTVGIEQAPRNAQMVAGIYNFAISVKSINDTTNQIKWYLVEEGNKYWFGGTELVKSITKKFNAINFGVNNDNTITQFNVLEVMVDYGTITVPEAPWQAYYVDKWGKSTAGGPWPIKNNAETLVGDASMGDGKPSTGWSTLSGGFGQALPLKTDKELIVKGQIQLVGGGGGDAYTHLRYGITFQDSLTFQNALTDTAKWVSTKGFYGYSFHPRSGNATMSNARGGAGTVWLVDGGGFHSGWGGNNTAQVGVKGNTLGIDQIPRNAEMIAGKYNFAISIKMVNDTSSIVKWYLIEENNKYYFGGTETLKSKTNKFNAINFGVNNDSKATMFNVLEVKVDYGTLVVPDAPFEPFYVGDWGFIGNRLGGWTLTPGELTGDVAISGTAAPTGWSAIRGGFNSPVKPTLEKAMVVTGKMELQGGGFEAWSSLRLGLFLSDSAGTVTNNAWSGLERAHSGYLFIPHSGSNDLTNWTGPAQLGTVGAVVNGTWISTNGATNYVLTNKKQKGGVVATAGKYNFAFSIGPKSDGSNEVRYYIYKEDKSYSFGGIVIDNHNPIVAKVFNSFNIGLNTNANTKALKITDLYVNLDKHITIPEDVLSIKAQDGEIPTQYNLSQNYPNPFNPSTTIDFALPQSGNVSLVVYDVLGREVANLVQGEFAAGNYKVNFDASKLSSGIYFYKLQSEEFVSIKKLMLLK